MAQALALVQNVQDIPDSVVPDNVLVHVRFYPNGVIGSISERPETLSEREWFERLLNRASECYQVLAGGRGFFRIPRPHFEAILSV